MCGHESCFWTGIILGRGRTFGVPGRRWRSATVSRTHCSTRVSRRATEERPPRRALLTKAVRHGGANYEALGVLATVGSGGGLHQNVEALRGQL